MSDARLVVDALHPAERSDHDRALAVLCDVACPGRSERSRDAALWRQLRLTMQMAYDTTPYCRSLVEARYMLQIIRCEIDGCAASTEVSATRSCALRGWL